MSHLTIMPLATLAVGCALMPLATLAVGCALTLAGYFGPEDGGTLEVCGLVLIGLAIWKGLF